MDVLISLEKDTVKEIEIGERNKKQKKCWRDILNKLDYLLCMSFILLMLNTIFSILVAKEKSGNETYCTNLWTFILTIIQMKFFFDNISEMTYGTIILFLI